MVPAGYSMPDGITGPMPAEVAEHVAAVALFGKPSNSFLNFIDRNAPPIKIGHLYQRKTIDLCVAEDPVCSATGNDKRPTPSVCSHRHDRPSRRLRRTAAVRLACVTVCDQEPTSVDLNRLGGSQASDGCAPGTRQLPVNRSCQRSWSSIDREDVGAAALARTPTEGVCAENLWCLPARRPVLVVSSMRAGCRAHRNCRKGGGRARGHHWADVLTYCRVMTPRRTSGR